MPDNAGPEILGRRALNRAALEHQWLLRRRSTTALEAVEHLVGLQARLPSPGRGPDRRFDFFVRRGQ